jgi:hypothetical protein
MRDEILNAKLRLLEDILATRLRYITRWDNVRVDLNRDNDVVITWFNESNADLFERIIYPIKSIDSAIKTQKRKLLRDIPDNEKEVYREALC